MSFATLAFTPAVKELQEKYGSRTQYSRREALDETNTRLTDFEIDFLAQRDSLYWATTGSTGWPYVQHRGGTRGFLKVIDDRTLALADFRGNKQYISTGNLAGDNRVAIIMVDYPHQARLKILGRVETLTGAAAEPFLHRVSTPGYKAVIERVFLIHIEAFDWNCPQHITPRFTADEIRDTLKAAEDRFHLLEAENQKLRAEIALLRARP